MTRFSRRVAVFALATTSAYGLSGTYQAVILHPGSDVESSTAYVASGNNQFGSFQSRATRWSGTAASYVQMPSANAYFEEVYGGNGTDVAGFSYVIGFTYTPTIWQNGVATYLSTAGNPSGGVAYDALNGASVGYLAWQAPDSLGSAQAQYWPTPTSEPINLHPASGAEMGSFGTSVGNGYQAGYVFSHREIYFYGVPRAAMWFGSPESFVDMNPAGYESSVIMGVDGGNQFGYVQQSYGGSSPQAATWSGTPESIVLMHPAGYVGSQLDDGRNGKVAGLAWDETGNAQAAVWEGLTAASFVNLHQLLPPGYQGSQATDVDEQGRVSGIGYPGNGTAIAILWVPVTAEQYVISQFREPVNIPPQEESVFKQGRTVPLKLNITHADGSVAANLTVTLAVYEIGVTAKAVNETSYTLAADQGVLFRYTGGQYIYNLSTAGMRAGYRYKAVATVVESGQTQSVTFAVR